MADDSIPAARFSLPAFSISQAPFLQSYNGVPSPFANQQDQIQQSMAISGVYPGQMPFNAFMGNTPPRYAFGRSVPGTSPQVGSLTSMMQNYSNPNPQTGVNLGLLGGPQGGYSPGTYPPPGGGGFGAPPPGNPAPPPFPGPSGGGAPPPSGGGLLGGWTGANHGGQLRSDPQYQAAQFKQLQQTGMQALQGVTDPAMRYMISMAYGIAPATIGLTNQQINQLEESTMGQSYDKKTGQVRSWY